MKIVLDTNFLVYCAEKRIDYLNWIDERLGGEKEILVFDKVLEELKKLSEKAEKGRDKTAAKLALKILSHHKIKIIQTKSESADKAILELVEREEEVIVATLDRELIKKVKNRGKVLVIHSGMNLELK